MQEHIESEGYMAKIIDGEHVDSKSFISDAKVRLNSAKTCLLAMMRKPFRQHAITLNL